MKSNHVNNKMLFLLNRELPEEEQMIAEKHLQTCKECSAAFARLQNTMSVIDEEKKLEASPFLYSKIQNRIDILKETKEKTFYRPSVSMLLKPVYISLFIIFAVISGMFLGNNLNISSKASENSTTYTINTTKDFYILGVDDEAN